jgi:serine/threonine protein kinase
MNLSWVGLEIDGALIESVIGEGGFSVVYMARGDGPRLVFKVARPEAHVSVEPQTGCFNTLAQAPDSSGISDIAPQPGEVLACQYERLTSIESDNVVRPLSSNEVAGVYYYTMPMLEGVSLRRRMLDKSAPISVLADLASACARLSDRGFVHGDLKPENIVLTDHGPVLIDPGHFGPLVVTGVKIQHCFITTPAYYPLYTPDDLLALGIMLWEMVLGRQPFACKGFSGKSELSRCGPDLIEFVRDLEKVSRYSFSSALDLRFPTELRPELTADQEDILLKALRLRRSRDGKLELGDGFHDFLEYARAVRNMRY